MFPQTFHCESVTALRYRQTAASGQHEGGQHEGGQHEGLKKRSARRRARKAAWKKKNAILE